jgi:hypothetical protein
MLPEGPWRSHRRPADGWPRLSCWSSAPAGLRPGRRRAGRRPRPGLRHPVLQPARLPGAVPIRQGAARPPTKADFDRTAAAPEGLSWLYAFAQQRNKPFSVGEWGVVPTGDAGKENPSFIRWMHEWFAAHADNLAYEAYFSDCGAGGVQSSLYNTEAKCTRNPGSAEVYRELWAA